MKTNVGISILYSIVIGLFLSLIAISCIPQEKNSNEKPEYPKYKISIVNEVPDSLQKEKSEYIARLTAIAIAKPHTDDTGDIIEQIELTSNGIYSRRIKILRIENTYENYEFVYESDMTKSQKEIFNSLLSK